MGSKATKVSVWSQLHEEEGPGGGILVTPKYGGPTIRLEDHTEQDGTGHWVVMMRYDTVILQIGPKDLDAFLAGWLMGQHLLPQPSMVSRADMILTKK